MNMKRAEHPFTPREWRNLYYLLKYGEPEDFEGIVPVFSPMVLYCPHLILVPEAIKGERSFTDRPPRAFLSFEDLSSRRPDFGHNPVGRDVLHEPGAWWRMARKVLELSLKRMEDRHRKEKARVTGVIEGFLDGLASGYQEQKG